MNPGLISIRSLMIKLKKKIPTGPVLLITVIWDSLINGSGLI